MLLNGFARERESRDDAFVSSWFPSFRHDEHNTPVEVSALNLRQIIHLNVVGYVDAWKANHPRDWIKQKEKMIKKTNTSARSSDSTVCSRSPAIQMSSSSASTNDQGKNEVILIVIVETD